MHLQFLLWLEVFLSWWFSLTLFQFSDDAEAIQSAKNIIYDRLHGDTVQLQAGINHLLDNNLNKLDDKKGALGVRQVSGLNLFLYLL